MLDLKNKSTVRKASGRFAGLGKKPSRRMPKGFHPLPSLSKPARRLPKPNPQNLARLALPWLYPALVVWLSVGLVAGLISLAAQPLRTIQLSGHRTLAAEQVLRQAGLTVQTPLAAIDPFAVTRKLSSHPRIVAADVRRIFPDQMLIAIEERRPAQRVETPDGRIVLLDAEDNVLGYELPGTERDDSLPLIRGIGRHPLPGGKFGDPRLRQAQQLLMAFEAILGADQRPLLVELRGSLGMMVQLDRPGARLLLPAKGFNEALEIYANYAGQLKKGGFPLGEVDLRHLAGRRDGRILARNFHEGAQRP